MSSTNPDLSKPTCRVCLQTSQDNKMFSIFDLDRDSSDLHIFEKIEHCTGIKIIHHDKLPTLICVDCYGVLKVSYKFRIICRNSDEYLKEFVVDTKTCKQIQESNPKPHQLSKAKSALSIKGTRLHQQQRLNERVSSPSKALQYGKEIAQTLQIEKDITPNTPSNCKILDNVKYENNKKDEEMWLDADYQEDDIDFSAEEKGVGQVKTKKPMQNKIRPTGNMKKFSNKPSKTLGISSDGAAIICEKEPLNKHDKNEKQPHICDICGNVYQRRYTLEVHMKRHRNEKPFECEICSHAFHSNFELIRHMRRHTGSRPYKCNYCTRAFGDQSTLIKHERIHRNERPFKCETCGESFTYSNVLKYHMYTHTGEKPYICEICGKSFTRQHHLRAHLETLQHQSQILLQKVKKTKEW